jgi:hypothetical protein
MSARSPLSDDGKWWISNGPDPFSEKEDRDLTGDVVHEPGVGRCWVCDGPADYLDLSFEAPVCGGICVWAAWAAYGLANRGRDPW